MLTPEYLQGLPKELENLSLDLEEYLIDDICRRIKKVGSITDTAAYEIMRLKEMGAATEYIEKKIAEFTELSEAAVKQAIFDAAQTDNDFYREVYQKSNRPFVPYRENKYLQQLTLGTIEQTCGQIRSFTKSAGFMILDGKGRLVFTPSLETYRNTMNQAFWNVSTGSMDYFTAIRRAEKELAENGMYFVDFDSGHRDHADVAIRRALLTGVSQLAANISKYNAEQLGTNIVEVTAHAGARPAHAAWQGGWYSLSGKDETYNGVTYKEIVKATGYGTGAGLMGWNCRHTFFPVVPGIDKPSYTEEELKNIDPPPVKIDGRTYTYYEAEQRQRYMERSMRKTKRQLIAADANGDTETFTAKSVKLRRQKEEYRKFSKAAGLLPREERASVFGYGHSISSKSAWAVRKAAMKNNGGSDPSGGSAAVTKTPKTPKGGNGGQGALVDISPKASNGGTGKIYQDEKLSQKGLTNNMISGKIEEKEYNVPYGKYSIDAEMDRINSKEYENKFKNATNNEVVNKTLLECSRSAIKHRTGTKFEDMYIINADTGEVMGSQLESECEQGIVYNDSIKNALNKAKEKNIPIIALHNHPEGFPPSIDDFNKAFENNYVMGFVAGHNGQLYRYQNKKACFENADDIQSDIVFIYNGGADVDRAYGTVYKRIDIAYDILRGDE